MDFPDLDIYIERFKLLGHPTRLQILEVLRRSPQCVCHLEALLHKPQPYISQQLRVLREANVLADIKNGQNVYYHLVNTEIAALLNTTLGPVLPDGLDGHRRVPGCACPRCNTPSSQEIELFV
ncbi:MAG: metalloregulator ArsR/SmtB family transcription factor [Caldilineales bacterium]